jgi:mRNA-degrading endonuclease toxin of MazEF toxin-antitoxin module
MVPFTFTDASGDKIRPVLIISNNEINRDYQYGDFVGIAITTQKRQTPYSLEIDTRNLQEGRLPVQSLIHCNKIAAILKDKVVKKLGTIDDKTFSAVMSNVLAVFKN